MGSADPNNLGEQLSAYLDGELDRREHAAVEALLKTSEPARARLAELRRISAAVGDLPRHAAPASIGEELVRIVERQDLLGEPGRPRRAWARKGRLIGSLIAAAALLFLSISVGLRVFEQMQADTAAGLAARSGPDDMDALQAGGLEAVATLDQKIEAGWSSTAMAAHRFANEPNTLQLAFSDAAERRLTYDRWLSALRSGGSVDLTAGGAVSSQTSFYLSGRADLNYGSTDDAQLLVHVPRSALLQLLGDATSREQRGGASTMTLCLGPLSSNDARQIRAWLGGVASSPGGGEAEAATSSDPDDGQVLNPFRGILDVERDATGQRVAAADGGTADDAAALEPGEEGRIPLADRIKRKLRQGRPSDSSAVDAAGAARPAAEDLITLVVHFTSFDPAANSNTGAN